MPETETTNRTAGEVVLRRMSIRLPASYDLPGLVAYAKEIEEPHYVLLGIVLLGLLFSYNFLQPSKHRATRRRALLTPGQSPRRRWTRTSGNCSRWWTR